MKSLKMAFVLGLVVLGLSRVVLADGPTPEQLLKERLDVMKAQAAVEGERGKANGALQAKVSGYWGILSVLQGPVKTDEQVKALEQQLEQTRMQLESLKGQVASLERQVDVAKIKDPAQRDAKLKDLQKERDAAQQELNAASEPFNKRVQALQEPLAKSEDAFKAALRTFFKDGSGDYAGAKVAQVSWFSTGNTGQVHWKTDSQVAWAAVFLNQQVDAAPGPGAKAIDAKYPIWASATMITVHAGHFNIMMNIDKKEWQGDEAKVIALVKNLIDLDALGALKPQ